MNGHPQPDEKYNHSHGKFPKIEDTYIFDPSSEIYQPKTYYQEKKRGGIVNKILKTWVPIIISAGTFWLLGKTVVIAEKQWEQMRIATDASTNASHAAQSAAGTAAEALQFSRDSFREDQRPYISLPGQFENAKFGQHEGRARAIFPIQNYGKSPATAAVYFAKIAIGAEQIKFISFKYPTDREIGIIPPGVQPGIVAFSEPVASPDDLKKPMVIYGRIEYTDMFPSPKPRYSSLFCQAANVEMTVGGLETAPCKGKNEIK